LKEYNCLKPELGDQVPMCYPFMPLKPLKKTFFYEEGIFIPSFWNDVLLRGRSGFAMEEHISENLLPLPLDHRYGTGQCEKVMEIIRKLY
jgi:hypothetical protein